MQKSIKFILGKYWAGMYRIYFNKCPGLCNSQVNKMMLLRQNLGIIKKFWCLKASLGGIWTLFFRKKVRGPFNRKGVLIRINKVGPFSAKFVRALLFWYFS